VWWIAAAHAVLRTGLDDGRTTVVYEGPVGAIVLGRRPGTCVVLTLGGELLLLDSGRSRVDVIARVTMAGGERLNDGGADPWGDVWFGSAGALTGPAVGRRFRLQGGHITQVGDAVGLSNGVAWEPGTARRVRWVDSAARTLTTFECGDDGALMERSRVVVPEQCGVPDGICLDVAANTWVAMWGGGSVECLSPDGAMVERVALPRRLATSCCFVGDGLDRLAVTTAGDVDERYVAELWLVEGVAKCGVPAFAADI
jgi:sugar lactone lactonase YvrE